MNVITMALMDYAVAVYGAITGSGQTLPNRIA